MVLLVALIACTASSSGDPSRTGGRSGDSGSGDSGSSDDGCVTVEGTASFDAWGGDTRADLGPRDAFEVTTLCGRTWLVTPGGHPAVSVAVNTTGPAGSTDRVTGANVYADTVDARYADHDAWAEATAARLSAWGFHGVGAWSDTDLLAPHTTVSIHLGLAQDDWESGEVADYYDEAWVTEVRARVAAGVRPGDPNVVGYFLDNEVHWGPDWRTLDTLLQSYLALPAEAAGKQAAVRWLLEQTDGLDELNEVLSTSFSGEEELLAATDAWDALDFDAEGRARELVDGFLAQVARRYFEVTVAAVREADPGHLILGNREVGVMTPEAVWRAQADLVDVVSVNRYTYIDGLEEAALALSRGVDPGTDLAAIHALTGKPLLVSEFGFRAADAGLPNSWPPVYPTFDTQAERAQAYEDQVTTWQQAPWIVGWHWYRWVDDPIHGRFDGEDNNWGLVSELDQPYDELVDRTATVNPRVFELLRVPAP
ncbi:MAG: hypothetical protein D6798_05880 [Deltaproteobacteria bacterium]|nr:MAG: hypothetical protein D6798_05880 [Deltaproteobacteria bacterium]